MPCATTSVPTSVSLSARAGAWRAGAIPLLVITAAQLTLVLDDSIVNIALPSIQQNSA